ncbi:MAG: Xaa-Pro dipeptidyl-peptidase [Flavobacteriales bacterium]
MKTIFYLTLGLTFLNHTFAQQAKPIFREGQAQIVPAFNKPSDWIKEELWVQTNFDSDQNGKLDRMHVFLTRPLQTNTEGLKLPVIYMSSPYFAGTGGDSKSYYWNVKHELGQTPPVHKHAIANRKENRPLEAYFNDLEWVNKGFITVYSSSPGTGFSDGVPTIGGENEKLAPAAVIDWLCGRAIGYTTRTGTDTVTAFWCTGKVGMMGTSYNGTLCLAAACTGVKGLEAIIPNAPVSSWYLYYRSNGLVRSPGGYLGEDTDILYDFIHSGDPENRAHNDALMRDQILVPGQDRITGDYNAFWASRDYLTQMDSMKAALFMCHGFEDWNVMAEHSFRFYEQARRMGLPAKIYYNQKGHGYPPPHWMLNKWFTKYLHGVDNGVEKMANAWIVSKGENEAHPYKAFPNPDSKMQRQYLQTGNQNTGSLSKQKGAAEVLSFTDDASLSAVQLISEKYAANRLLFWTNTLMKPLHLSGTGRIHVQISSDKPAANLSVYLIAVPQNYNPRKIKIEDIIVNRAWADPQNHGSIEKGEPMNPGDFYDLTFNFQPDDQIIPTGYQLGLLIFSSDKEFTIQPKKGTKLTVKLDESWLELRVVE